MLVHSLFFLVFAVHMTRDHHPKHICSFSQISKQGAVADAHLQFSDYFLRTAVCGDRLATERSQELC